MTLRTLPLFLIFLAFFVTAEADIRKFICSKDNPVFKINSGEVVLFESPSFPQTIKASDDGNNLECAATFTRSDQKNNGLWFAFTNGYTYMFEIQDMNGTATKLIPGELYNDNLVVYDSTKSSSDTFFHYGPYDISLKYGYITFPNIDELPWRAFQAVVYAPSTSNLKTNCWLSDQVFSFSDEIQVIPIISFEASNISEFCQWTFTVPDGFQLKINTRHFTLLENEQVLVISDSGKSEKINESSVMYLDGKKFQIQYNRTVHNMDEIGIVAFISASKKSQSMLVDCINFKVDNNGAYVYSNLDTQNGYGNNINCLTSFNVSSNKIHEVSFTNDFMELMADVLQLQFHPDGDSFDLLPYNNYLLNPNSASFPTHLRFISDGSIVQSGFEMIVEPKDCDCSVPDFIIPCNSKSSFLPITADNKMFYCSNMNCSWNLISNTQCPDSIIKIDIYPNLRDSSLAFDQFSLFANGKMESNITSAKPQELKKHLFEYGTSLTARFIARHNGDLPVAIAPFLTIYITHMTVNNTINLHLTDTNQASAVNLAGWSSSSLITVNSSNDILDLFVVGDPLVVMLLNRYSVYDGNEYLGTLKDGNPASGASPMRFTSEIGKFSILNDVGDDYPVTLFFRKKSSYSTACPNSNNVFQMSPALSSVTLKTDNLCAYTFVNYGKGLQKMRISNLQQTSKNSEVNFFSPDINYNVQYFNFTDSTASSWNDVVLKGLYNTLFMKSGTVSMNVHDEEFNPTNDTTLKGILYSDNYGRPSVSIADGVARILGIISNTDNSTTTFTCQVMGNGILQITQQGKLYKIEKPGQSVVINSPGEIMVNYSTTSPMDTGALLIYEKKINTSSSSTVCFNIAALLILVFVKIIN